MTNAQRQALQALCERYHVPFRPSDFKPAYDLPKGYVAGWVGPSPLDGMRRSNASIMVGPFGRSWLIVSRTDAGSVRAANGQGRGRK